MMKADLNRLVDKPLPEITLGAAGDPPAIRSKTAIERKQVGTVASNEVTVESTDGLFTFTVRIVKA
jgi:hypothetical protein